MRVEGESANIVGTSWVDIQEASLRWEDRKKG